MVGQNVTAVHGQGIAVVGLALVLAFIFLSGGSTSRGPSSQPFEYDDDEDDVIISPEYQAGWNDHNEGKEYGQNMPRSASYAAHSPASSPSGGFGMPSMGMGNVFTMFILGKQLYELGGGQQWNAATFMMALKSLPVWRQAILGMLVLRVFGMSPI
jgi:hypothetical protein